MKTEKKEIDRERVKEIIAECFIKGFTKTKTIERVSRLAGEKLYPVKLNKLLDEIMATWSKKGIRDKVLMRAVELKKIDSREAELWQAWDESKSMGEGADARYLTELRHCSVQRAKLLGLAGTGKSGNEEKTSIIWNESRRYGTDNPAD